MTSPSINALVSISGHKDAKTDEGNATPVHNHAGNDNDPNDGRPQKQIPLLRVINGTSFSEACTKLSETSTVSDSAEAYVRRGWRVIEVRHATKRPQQLAWAESAIVDLDHVHSLFPPGRMVNIGLLCGRASNLIVLDVDKKHGGLESYQMLRRDLGIDWETVRVLTPGGGLHEYFVYPDSLEGELRTKTSLHGYPGIEIRADGNHFVVAPPSLHPDGGIYAFDVGRDPGSMAPAPFPDGLLSLAKGRKHERPATRSVGHRFDLNQEFEPADMETIARGCSWFESTIERRRELSEPEWMAQLSIVGCCAKGRELAHEISKDYGRYTPEETDAKLSHAMDDAGPWRCDTIAERFDCAACRSCPFSGRITTPVQLGRKPRATVEIQRRYVSDVVGQQYVDLTSGSTLPNVSFDDLVADKLECPSPHRVLKQDGLTRKMQGLDYLPGDERLFIPMEGGGEKLNTWRPGGVLEQPGHPTFLLDHFSYIFADAVACEYVLDALAHLVQRPATKIRSIAVLGGSPGIGKTFLRHLMTDIFGTDNVNECAGHNIGDKYNASLGNCQLLVSEELQAFDRWDVFNRTKTLISEEQFEAEEKYVRRRHIRSPRWILALSNHEEPIALPKDDRRWLLIWSNAVQKDRPYYQALWHEGRQEAGSFKRWLRERDISGFNPDAAPPMTDAKRNVIAASRSHVVQELELAMLEERPPFSRDLGTIQDVIRYLWPAVAARRPPSARAIAKALGDLGASKRGQVGELNGTKPHIWIWRNRERWDGASGSEILSYLKSR